MHQHRLNLPHCVVSSVAYQPGGVAMGYRALEETVFLGSKSILVFLTISLEILFPCKNT
jgi:hypothetical protein